MIQTRIFGAVVDSADHKTTTTAYRFLNLSLLYTRSRSGPAFETVSESSDPEQTDFIRDHPGQVFAPHPESGSKEFRSGGKTFIPGFAWTGKDFGSREKR